MNLEQLIETASPELREISYHSDQLVIEKTGARAKHPKKLYCSSKIGTWGEKTKEAIIKLIKENK